MAAVENFDRKPVELIKAPDDFRIVERKTEELGVRALHVMARKLAEEGYDATRYRVDMQARLATPFASVIMAFLGIPFALQKKRGASLAMGITISVAIGITYHIIQAILLAFGYSAVLPPPGRPIRSIIGLLPSVRVVSRTPSLPRWRRATFSSSCFGQDINFIFVSVPDDRRSRSGR
jgi:hypothetical protein